MAGIQIGGIASGFDTTSMVEKLMEAEKTKVTKIENQKKMAEYQQEAYNEVNELYSNFILNMRKNFGINNFISTTGATRNSAANNLSWMNKATSSNNNALTAVTTSAAKAGKHEVVVQQLADTAKFASSSKVNLDPKKTLKEQLGVDNFEITITTAKGTTTIKDTDGTMTFQQLVDQMNKIEGVNASFDPNIGRFFLQTSETGADNFIQIDEVNSGGLLNQLNIGMTSGVAYHGQNAIIDYNGATNIEFSSNQINLQGLELNLKQANPNETITITVDTDTETILSKVNTFIEEYNNLIDKIGDKLVEKKYRDYEPLTDEQKKAMTEREVELWEEKVKSGLIRNDQSITKIQDRMREALFQPIKLADGTTVSLSDFGIEGKGYFEGGNKGELKIDEDKFRQAIKGQGDVFAKVLFNTPTDSDLNVLDKGLTQTQLSKKREESGIFNRLSDIIVGGMQEIINKAGTGDKSNTYRQISSNILLDFVKSGSKSLIDNMISDYNSRIDRLNTALTKIENRYWSQFTAMEKAVSQMQAQQSALGSFMM